MDFYIAFTNKTIYLLLPRPLLPMEAVFIGLPTFQIGSRHGGRLHNIGPDKVQLQLLRVRLKVGRQGYRYLGPTQYDIPYSIDIQIK